MAGVGGQPSLAASGRSVLAPSCSREQGARGSCSPTAIAFLAISLIYFETPARPTSPSTFPGGQRGRPAAVPTLPPGLSLSPIPWCLCLQHLCCLATLLVPWAEQRVPGSSAVPSSVCPSSGPTPSGKLRAAFGQAAPGTHGLLLHEWPGSVVALWPGLCHRGGWWSGSWYGWGSAPQCCLCRVLLVLSWDGGVGWLFF